MRIVLLIMSFGLLASFQEEPTVLFKVAGEPSCVVKGKEYIFKARVVDPEENEHIYLEGNGLVIKKMEAKDMYNFVVPTSSKTARINVGVRNSKTKKIKQVESIDFTICE